ncbi:hypothetical protein ATCC90586_004573 [Pythium insidiosum]|nr:hypothetical protein ATCC90586_004573 [Pythium insidiosum]
MTTTKLSWSACPPVDGHVFWGSFQCANMTVPLCRTNLCTSTNNSKTLEVQLLRREASPSSSGPRVWVVNDTNSIVELAQSMDALAVDLGTPVYAVHSRMALAFPLRFSFAKFSMIPELLSRIIRCTGSDLETLKDHYYIGGRQYGKPIVDLEDRRLHPVADAAYAETLIRNISAATESSSTRNVIHIVSDRVGSTEFQDASRQRLYTVMKPFVAGKLKAQRGQWLLSDVADKPNEGVWTSTAPTSGLTSQTVRVKFDSSLAEPDDWDMSSAFSNVLTILLIGAGVIVVIVGVVFFAIHRKQRQREIRRFRERQQARQAIANDPSYAYAHHSPNQQYQGGVV